MVVAVISDSIPLVVVVTTLSGTPSSRRVTLSMDLFMLDRAVGRHCIISSVLRYLGLGGGLLLNCSDDSLGAGELLGNTSREPQLALLSDIELQLEED